MHYMQKSASFAMCLETRKAPSVNTLFSNSNEPVDNAIGLCCHDLCNIFKIAVFNEISILDTGLFRLALTIRLSILHRMFDYSASHPK